MLRWIFAVLLGLTSIGGAAAQQLGASPLPIEAIAQHPAIQSVSISPDGRHIAGLIALPNQRWPAIAVWSVDNLNQPPVAIPSTQMRPRSVSFLGNDHVVFFVDQPINFGSYKTFTVQAVVTDLRGSRFTQPFGGALGGGPDDPARGGVNWAVLQAGTIQDPNRYILVRTQLEGQGFGNTEVVAVDASTLRTERVARTASDESVLVADPRDGQLMVKETLVHTDGAWHVRRLVRDRATGQWREHPALGFAIRDRRTITPLGFFDANPDLLYVSTNHDNNFQRIRVYNIATQQWEPDVAVASEEYDVISVGPQYNPLTRSLEGIGSYTIAGPDLQQRFLDPTWGPIQRGLEQQFPGQSVSIARAWNTTSTNAIVTVSGPRHPPAYYILLNGRELRLIGRSRPWINSDTLGETTFVHYQARDGLSIPGFLTLPAGYDRARHGRIPLVVLPHGGPWARDYLGWDSSGWPQFLATRGYAVLQPQYRGSDGWGMAHWYAGDREWGQKMSDDNDDGAAWLIQEGIADPNRIAIFGYSYGGFAAVAASVRQNGPYRCALAGAPVTDLQRLANLWGANRIQRELQGWTVDGMNPIANVSRHSIPILIYHGEHDRQADTVHSREFYRAMRSAGGTVEYHEIEKMWHQLPWWPEWHRESLGYIESWLAGPNCFGGAQHASN